MTDQARNAAARLSKAAISYFIRSVAVVVPCLLLWNRYWTSVPIEDAIEAGGALFRAPELPVDAQLSLSVLDTYGNTVVYDILASSFAGNLAVADRIQEYRVGRSDVEQRRVLGLHLEKLAASLSATVDQLRQAIELFEIREQELRGALPSAQADYVSQDGRSFYTFEDYELAAYVDAFARRIRELDGVASTLASILDALQLLKERAARDCALGIPMEVRATSYPLALERAFGIPAARGAPPRDRLPRLRWSRSASEQ